MNLQPRTEQITVQQEFVFQTAGLIHKVGNVTLDAAAFEGQVKAGTIVVLGETLATPYDGATYTAAAGRVYVTTTDVKVADLNVQVGALEEGYLRGSRLTNLHANFEEHSGYRFKVRG